MFSSASATRNDLCQSYGQPEGLPCAHNRPENGTSLQGVSSRVAAGFPSSPQPALATALASGLWPPCHPMETRRWPSALQREKGKDASWSGPAPGAPRPWAKPFLLGPG